MLLMMIAAVQVEVRASPSLPAAPPPPPPFTQKVEAAARRIGARVEDEFKRCGDARANGNARSVEAMGTPKHSAEWETATVAVANALTVCRGLRHALRDQQRFLAGVARNGTPYDRGLAAGQLVGVRYEIEGIEQYYADETPRYRDLRATGWGNPHCVDRPDGFMPPSSICPNGTGASHR